MERYYERSRLSKKEERTAYRKIFLAVGLSIAGVLAIIYLGIPLLINMAVFISNLKGEGDLPQNNNQSAYISPPTLDSPYEATNTAHITLKGMGTPGTKVEVFWNGDSLKKFLIPKDGTFIVEKAQLNTGENKFWAIAENSQSLKSERSEILMVTYKKGSPKIEISSPDDGARISNDTKTVTVSGATEGVSGLTINDRVVILDTFGKFSYNLPLGDGDNNVVIVAIDDAGNQTRIERKVNFNAP